MNLNPVLTTALLAVLSAVPPAGSALAGSFESVPLAPDRGVTTFDREAARRLTGRDLLGEAWGGVVLSRTDVYDRFPWVESRTFQIVSDPAWNRIVIGDTRGGFTAWDGAGTTPGALSEPRGLALGGSDRLYVCDSGHDRVLILRIDSTFDEVTLTPVGVIDGLSRPYAVAVSDGGTPDDARDDRLYVTETGRNRVALVALGRAPRVVATIGGLGSGVGRFAGPLAIAVGRSGTRNTNDVYVADVHSQRIVRLTDTGSALAWADAAPAPYALVTGLDTDETGALYVSGPAAGAVARLSSLLEPLAEVRPAGTAPRQFGLVRAHRADHRPGGSGSFEVASAPARGVMIGGWADGGGISLWRLRPEAVRLTSPAPDRLEFRLTGAARVAVTVRDPASRASLWHGDLGVQAAGDRVVDFRPLLDGSGLTGGRYLVELVVRPAGEGGGEDLDSQSAALELELGGGALRETGPRLLAIHPNPVREGTVIRVAVPAAGGAPVAMGGELFDSAGRLVRRFGTTAPVAGVVELPWDGRDDAGHRVPSGVYFYRLEAGGTRLSGQLVVTR